MPNDPLPAPKPANVPPGVQNGDSKIPAGFLDQALFAQVVAQRERAPEPAEPEVSPLPPVKGDPEALTDDPPPSDEPANQDLPEEQPPDEGDEPTPGDGDEPVLSQPEDKALNEALAAFNPDAKKHLLEMVKAVEAGEVSLGELKRNLKLGRKENEELQKLREENEQLKTNPPVVTAPKELPPAVAKLKTVQEIQQFGDNAERAIRQIEDFLDENPQGGEMRLEDGTTRELTRPQLIQAKRNLQDQMKALPKAAQAIVEQQKFQQERAAMKAATLKDFPFLADANHPDAATVKQLLVQPQFATVPNAEYLALCMARGHRELQGELAKRKPGQPASRPAVKTGVAPAAKPHAGTPSAPARSSQNAPSAKALLKEVKDTNSFASFLTAAGR